MDNREIDKYLQEHLATFKLRLVVLEMRLEALEQILGLKNINQDPYVNGIEGPKAHEESYRIVSIDSRVLEANEVWTKYSWKVILENKSNKNLLLIATIQFLDSEGFELHSDYKRDIQLLHGGTQSFSGTTLVDASVAGQVASIGAEIRLSP